MSPNDFLAAADDYLAGEREADWRSAVSRAYYAAFHVARSLLAQQGFEVPRSDKAHAYLWLRLSNCGHPDVVLAGGRLRALRQARGQADYDLDRPLAHLSAADQVLAAHGIVELLDELRALPVALAAVVDAIRVYERDVLQDVTWRP